MTPQPYGVWYAPAKSSHSVSVHSTDDGACLFHIWLIQCAEYAEWDRNGPPFCWDPSSSYLMWDKFDSALGPNTVRLLNMEGQLVWESQSHQRGAQDVSCLTRMAVAKTGPFLAVLDEWSPEREGEPDWCEEWWQSMSRESLLSILDASDGHMTFQYSPAQGVADIGIMKWAAASDMCLLPKSGIVIMALPLAKANDCPADTMGVDCTEEIPSINMSDGSTGTPADDPEPLKPAWCKAILVDADSSFQMKQPCSEDKGQRDSNLSMSPCGQVVVGLLEVQQVDSSGTSSQACSSKWQLRHWHMSDAAKDCGNTSPTGGKSRWQVKPRVCSGHYESPLVICPQFSSS